MDTDGNQSEVYQRWDDGFLVRRMRREEVRQVISWFESMDLLAVGLDLEVAFDMRGDTDDFFIGELNGEVIASLVAVQIADDLIYGGYLYVIEQYRKYIVFADRMLAVGRHIVERRNFVGIIAIDSVDHTQSMNEALGYKSAHKTISYQGTVSANVNQDTFGTDVRPVTKNS